MKYGIGVIGLGSIGLRMLASIACHDRFTVHTAWDPDARARGRASAAQPRIRLAANAADVIADDTVDLVYVACPPRFHGEHARSAFAAGKPVLCEKPLGVDLGDSRALVSHAKACGIANAVNLLFASARSGAEISTAIAQGSVGEVVWAELRFHLPRWAAKRYEEAPWLAHRAQGGFVREVVTHYVYLCRRLFGPLTIHRASMRYPDDALGAVRFAHIELSAGEVPITISGTTAAAGPEINECTIWGTGTSYRIRDIHRLDVARGNRWVEVYTTTEPAERDTHLRQLDELACLLEGKPHGLPDFRAAFEVQEVIEAILAPAAPPGRD